MVSRITSQFTLFFDVQTCRSSIDVRIASFHPSHFAVTRRDAPFVTIIRLPRLAFALLNMNQLQVKLLSENATLPKKGSPLSAGFDLSSAQDTVIQAGARGLVKTDISVACPPGTYARIAPRSGLAVKKGIDVGAGVVDADYRGPVGVVLFNFGDRRL